jgi:hypothetical protein
LQSLIKRTIALLNTWKIPVEDLSKIADLPMEAVEVMVIIALLVGMETDDMMIALHEGAGNFHSLAIIFD